MSAHEPIGHGLNPAQKEAVLYLDGPCLVLAGAGSGKTRVITQKIAYLLRECGYMGRNVVALTFTNKAAREMDERVKTLVDRKLGKGLTISTFHSLGVKLLREEARNAGLKPTFSILDADDAMAIIQELLATTDKGRLRHVQGIISLWKNALMDPDDAAREAITPGDVEAANVYRSYAATLAAYQAVDFDDLIRIPAILLANNEEVRTRWQNRVRYLLVDEYQDTNVCQYRLVQLLTGPRAMFTAVGDDDQAIYAWRGATIENLAKLTTDYPNLKLIKLEQNYRSVQRILAAANQVIEKNPKLFEKKLWSDLGVGEPIVVSAMDGEEHEAESIAMKISASRFERQAQWKDFAILYRGNHQSRILEQALRNLKIPYTIAGGQSFSTRPRCATSWPTCGCWPTTRTIRPSSARPPRPSAASARPRCRRWASTPPRASCRCWPRSRRPGWKACWRRVSSSRCAPLPNSSAACSGAPAAAPRPVPMARRPNRPA